MRSNWLCVSCGKASQYFSLLLPPLPPLCTLSDLFDINSRRLILTLYGLCTNLSLSLPFSFSHSSNFLYLFVFIACRIHPKVFNPGHSSIWFLIIYLCVSVCVFFSLKPFSNRKCAAIMTTMFGFYSRLLENQKWSEYWQAMKKCAN